MVESRPEMVDNFASEHTESRVNRPIDDEFLNSRNLPILIGDNWISCDYIHIQSNCGDRSQELSNLRFICWMFSSARFYAFSCAI